MTRLPTTALNRALRKVDEYEVCSVGLHIVKKYKITDEGKIRRLPKDTVIEQYNALYLDDKGNVCYFCIPMDTIHIHSKTLYDKGYRYIGVVIFK